MGYNREHAIIVCDHGYGDDIERAHSHATRIFPWISPLSPPAINGVRSFFIPPDGSKEGWGESTTGDVRRWEFLRLLEECKYEDGSAPLAWVEVQFCDDNHHNLITAANDLLQEADDGRVS